MILNDKLFRVAAPINDNDSLYMEPGDGGGGSGGPMPVPFYTRLGCENGRATIGCYSNGSFGDTQVTYRLFADSQYSQPLGYSGVQNPSIVYYFKGLEGGKTYYIEAYGNESTFNRKAVTALACQPDPFFIYHKDQKNVTSFGAADGEYEVEPKGGRTPYKYQIKPLYATDAEYSPLQDSPRFTGLKAGLYTVRGTDYDGKQAIVSPNITQPEFILLQITFYDPAAEMVAGGAPYAVTGPDDTIYFTRYTFNVNTETLVKEDYTRLRKDAEQHNGSYGYLHPTPDDFYSYCLANTTRRKWFSFNHTLDPKTVTNQDANAESCGYKPLPCSLEFSVIDIKHSSDPAAPNGSFSVTATSETGPIEYSLDGYAWYNAMQVNSVAPGSYKVLARDANNCQIETTVTVLLRVPCSLQVQAPEVVGDTVFIFAKSEFPISYSYDGGVTWIAENQKNCLAAGNYEALVRDTNGCEETINYQITEPELTGGIYFVYFLVIDSVYYRIDEPLKFDGMELQLKRDRKLHGVNYEYAELALGFDCSAGYELIKQQYKKHGCDAEIGYTVYVRECSVCSFEIEYTGRLNMTDYSDRLEAIEANVEQSGLCSLFTASLKKKVNLLDPLGVSGQITDPINPAALTLHSRAIVKNYEAKANAPYFVSELIENGQGKTSPFIVLGFGEIIADSLKKVNQTQPGFSYIRAKYPVFEPEESGVFDFDLYANIDVVVNRVRGDFDEIQLYLYYQLNEGPVEKLNSYKNTNVNGAFRMRNFEGRVNKRLTLEPGDKVYVYGELQVNDKDGNYQFTFELGMNSSSYLRISGTTLLQETEAKAFPVYEAMAKVIGATTGQSDALRSRFFGRVNSIPRSYDKDGPAALYTLLSGLMVRGQYSKGLALCFQDIIDGLNPVFNMGIGFSSENGKEVIVVENAEYFYQDAEIIAFPNVTRYKEDAAPDYIYNTVAIGFAKWEPEGRVENGLDEPNARREWVTPIRNHKNEYKAESKFIAGGYLLEAQRRAGITNNDSKNDNDTFIVAVERDDAGSYDTIYSYDAPNKACVTGTVMQGFERYGVGQTIVINGPENSGRYTIKAITQRWQFVSYPFPAVYIYDVLELDRPVNNPAAIFTDRIVLPGKFRSEADAPFSHISGLFAPETAYNLRITPARMFLNHSLFINSGCFFKTPEELYRTPYGEGNQALETRFKDSEERLLGDSSRALVRENQDLTISQARNGNTLYEPLFISFDAEVSRAQFAAIKAQRHGYIRVWNGEEWVLGYIMEAKYRISKRLCKFKLLKAAKTYIPGATQTREFNEREFNSREFN